MTTPTIASLSIEILRESLLTLEQVSTSVTVLALNASAHPEHSVRVRSLLGELLESIQACEGDLGTYAPLDA